MSPGTRAEEIERFCKTTRWFHWTFALSFLALAATGAALFLREEMGLRPEAVERLIDAHKIVAVVFLTAPWLIALSGDTRRWLGDLAEFLRVGPNDGAWLLAQLTPWRKGPLPSQQKFNAGQKINVLMVAATCSLMVATGLHLWGEPGAFLALTLHVAGFLFWIPGFLGHLFLALVNPGTRPALRGMLCGRVSRAWAREHHRLWVDAEDPR